MLQTSGRDETHAYTELVGVLLQAGSDPLTDIHELWRRLVFNFHICNTDDHLRNTELLYDARRRGWRLALDFDLNPMPGDRRESKNLALAHRKRVFSELELCDICHILQ